MRKSFVPVGLLCVLFSVGTTLRSESMPLVVEHGTFAIHLLLRTIGTEEYTVTDSGFGRLVMTTTSTTSERGIKQTTSSTLEMGPMFAPTMLEQRRTPASPDGGSLTEVQGTSVSVREAGVSRTMKKPPLAFVGFASMPAAVQMMMMRYWTRHHQPAQLPILRASEEALPLKIKLVGHEAFSSKGRIVRLKRYTVANLVFGREILWMNESGRLAAVMTFAGGLPQEEVLDEYEPVADELVHSGVQQEMLDLADLDRQVPPEAEGAFAIVGARLIDGTGAPAVENSAVVVRGGRIVAAGAMGRWPCRPVCE